MPVLRVQAACEAQYCNRNNERDAFHNDGLYGIDSEKSYEKTEGKLRKIRHSSPSQPSDVVMEFTIRDAGPEDRDTIADFNARMAEETEGKSLNPNIVGPGVQALLEDPAKGRYWIAESDGAVIGQIMVTYEWSDWRNGNLWWVQSVYVHPYWRRKGVFSALYKHVESMASAKPEVIGLRLYVEDNNKRAQQTYVALGMVKPGYTVMEAMQGSNLHHDNGDN